MKRRVSGFMVLEGIRRFARLACGHAKYVGLGYSPRWLNCLECDDEPQCPHCIGGVEHTLEHEGKP